MNSNTGGSLPQHARPTIQETLSNVQAKPKLNQAKSKQKRFSSKLNKTNRTHILYVNQTKATAAGSSVFLAATKVSQEKKESKPTQTQTKIIVGRVVTPLLSYDIS